MGKFKNFIIVWLGQFVSLFGSRLTEFALAVWVFEKTESITQFALIFLLFYVPNIIISPLAGMLIDSWDRRLCMMLSDLLAGITTFIIFLLVLNNHLELWHIYLAVTSISISNGLQIPAYNASISQLVSEKHYVRANGMVQAAMAVVKIVTPAIAGFLLGIIFLKGILIIDLVTFLLAIATLLFIRFPKVKKLRRKTINLAKILKQITYTWNYINRRANLNKLLIFMMITYFTFSIIEVLFWCLILSFSSSKELGVLLSIGGVGMLLGSLFVSLRKDINWRIYGIIFSVQLQGILLILFSLKTTILTAAIGIFGYLFAQPILVSCNLSIWQSKIPLDLQGRVFSLQQFLEKSLAIIAYIIIGPLVDFIFQPSLGNNVEITMQLGSTQGISLLISLIGIINILATFFVYGDTNVRRLDMVNSK